MNNKIKEVEKLLAEANKRREEEGRPDFREYFMRVEEEKKIANSLAVQFLEACEQQGVSEYVVSILPETISVILRNRQKEINMNTAFIFQKH